MSKMVEEYDPNNIFLASNSQILYYKDITEAVLFMYTGQEFMALSLEHAHLKIQDFKFLSRIDGIFPNENNDQP